MPNTLKAQEETNQSMTHKMQFPCNMSLEEHICWQIKVHETYRYPRPKNQEKLTTEELFTNAKHDIGCKKKEFDETFKTLNIKRVIKILNGEIKPGDNFPNE